MVVDVAPVGLVGGGTRLDLSTVLKPHVHPLSYGVLPCPAEVQLGVFRDGLFQFLFDLRLSFAQDVFVDGLACLRVPARGVAALPPSVLPLADTALAVGSAFCRSASLLSQRHSIPQTSGNSQGYEGELSVRTYLLRRLFSLFRRGNWCRLFINLRIRF